MLTEDTMRKLHEMRLTVMARTLREQLQDPAYNDMPFEDRVSLLVDRESLPCTLNYPQEDTYPERGRYNCSHIL